MVIRKKKKVKMWKKVLLIAVGLFILVGVGSFTYVYTQLSKMKTTKITKTDAALGISPNVVADDQITNIAFFGVDRRNSDEPGRSDSIIVMSIDAKHQKIKMSSVMRDTYVKVEGHGETKITHAYAYGGPQLAIKTLNQNFNLDIKDFVTVDFFNLEKIIDAVGGVTIDVQKNEINLLNSYMNETAGIEKKSITKVTKTGPQTLNGMQAVAYSRIRYTAGGDFERTERQRTVLTAMLNKIKSAGATQFPSLVSKLLQYTETSMTSVDILKMGTKVITSNMMNLDQERFPIDGYCNAKTIDAVWYLVPNMPATVDQMHKYIYDDIKPVPKAPLF